MGFIPGSTGGATGAAGGDLSGTYPNPTVVGLQGRPVAATAPSSSQALVWNGSAWAPATVTGAVTSVFSRTGAVVAATNDYTDAQVQNSPTNKLTTTGDLLYASAANTLARLGVGATGQVLVVTGGLPVWAYPPGYQFGYDQITSNVTVSSTTEASGTTVISAAAHTFDGGAAMCCFYSQIVAGTTAGSVTLSLFEGATQILEIAQIFSSLAAGISVPVYVEVPFPTAPTAGSHTYTVTGFKSGTGNGTVFAGAGGTATVAPAYVRFVKV